MPYSADSLDGRSSRIRQAYSQHVGYGPGPQDAWVEEVFDGYVIASKGGKYFRVPYTVEGEKISFGEPVEVEVVYETAQATFLAGIDLKDLVTQNLAAETEVQIALTGHYLQGEKEFDITVKDFEDAEKNYLAAENPLPVDYEHNTFVKGAEAPAAGWVKKIINRGERGLYAVIAWTKGAAEKIRSGEYKFISPVFFFNARDTKTGKPVGTLLGPPALTNFPLIQGMEPLTARKLEIRNSNFEIKKGKENSMHEFLKKLFAALGIDAGEEEVAEDKAIEMIKAKVTSVEPPKRPKVLVPEAILKELDLAEDATEDEATGVIRALKFPSDRIPVDRYRGLEEQLHERDINDLIDRACRPGESDMEGKLYPHEREWALGEARRNFEVTKAFIKHRPKVLSLMAKLPDKKQEEVQIDELQASINRQVNVSPEIFKKYNARTH